MRKFDIQSKLENPLSNLVSDNKHFFLGSLYLPSYHKSELERATEINYFTSLLCLFLQEGNNDTSKGEITLSQHKRKINDCILN